MTARADTTTWSTGLPVLKGDLLFHDDARRSVATDLGNVVRREPQAVLRPRSPGDVAAMITFCRERGITVAARGQAHTTNGQALTDGLVIECRSLDEINFTGPYTVEVGSGVLWKDLAAAAFERTPRLTPPVLTGYTGLTVGGTLSMGGVGGIVGGLRTGLQVDHVRELEVVTGTGSVERCSPEHGSDLFKAVLGGLGQCGVITKAVLALVPAKERARTYALDYTSNPAFFRDLRTAIARPGIDHVYAEVYPPGAPATHRLLATVLYDPSHAPDDRSVTEGLSGETTVEDSTYLDYVFSIDLLIDELRATAGWDRLLKPWYDVWIPGESIEEYLAEIHPSLTSEDLGPYGAVLIYPQRRDLVGGPYPRLPEPDGSDWAFVLDINTVAETVDTDRRFFDRMLDRNGGLFARARGEYGAVLYPIGSVRFTAEDWRVHFGQAWPAFRRAKSCFDPDGILAPGTGIFDGS